MKLNKVVLLFLLVYQVPLKANDTMATLAGGVIQYTRSSDISMDYEALTLSPKSIEIIYDFTNHSSHDVTSQVAFPLPLSPVTIGDTSRVYPVWDDLYHSYSYIHEVIESTKENAIQTPLPLRNRVLYPVFTDFSRTVNGEQYGYTVSVRAINNYGKDITNLLINNDIPLSSTYISGFMDEGPLDKEPKLKAKLQNLGLLDKKGKPLWQLAIIYHWQQSFAAKTTTQVTHRYTPHTGEHWLEAKNPTTLADFHFVHRDEINGVPEKKQLSNYCLTEQNKKELFELFTSKKDDKKTPIVHRVEELRYILSSGANWRGSIKKFKMIIKPPANAMLLGCFNAPLTVSQDNSYQVTLDNFTPTKDLDFLFVHRGNP